MTDDIYGKAVINKIETVNILKSLENGFVAIVSGFQGISNENRITTLGRGGSGTSAVALAAAFSADRCDIFTDVDRCRAPVTNLAALYWTCSSLRISLWFNVLK